MFISFTEKMQFALSLKNCVKLTYTTTIPSPRSILNTMQKDRVFCLCAQSRENKKVKKCVKLKYGCCG